MLEKVLPLFKLSSGCDYHRVVLPLGYAGYDFSPLKEMTNEKLSEYKTLIFNRTPSNVEIPGLQKLRDKGLKIVVDIDDYWYLYENHIIYKNWVKQRIPQRIESFIKFADTVICTTDRLASKIIPFNSNVHVIPNAMPFNTKDQFEFRRATASSTRFGYVGGASHLSDLRTIAPVFQTYSQIDFTMCGYSEKNQVWDKMESIISNDGKNKNYKRIEQKHLDQYMTGYDTIDCCIAPLTNDDFNSYKSNLKVLEAGLKRCAIICSANPCYTDTVPDSVVTYCKSIKDWKAAFKLHMDLDFTKEQGDKLHDWVKTNYDLAEINKQRLALL